MDDPDMLMAMATFPFINQEKLAIDAHAGGIAR